MPIVTQC